MTLINDPSMISPLLKQNDHCETIGVSHVSDVEKARQAVRAMSREMGFAYTVCEEIALAVSELATNLIKHAIRGDIRLARMDSRDRSGIQIESIDKGPGIRDIDQALADGFSTSGSLGYGLGSVVRLMDDIKVESRHPGGGTRVTCIRWKPLPLKTVNCPLDIGAATRPYPGMKVNGDAFVIKTGSAHATVAVIDGLGHGPDAHHAALKARACIERHPDQALETLFLHIDRECRSTRGGVLAIARFDFGEMGRRGLVNVYRSRQAHMVFAGIGNIEARVLGIPKPFRLVTRRGIVGKNAPKPLVTRHPWDPAAVLVLHSDGLQTKWNAGVIQSVIHKPAAVAARDLLRALDRKSDDATIVVVKWKGGTS
jgi:anti-sigma regulatory factor (Ser/Thr protein kinase)